MEKQRAPLLPKLNFAALVLILICLAVLLARSFQTGQPPAPLAQEIPADAGAELTPATAVVADAPAQKVPEKTLVRPVRGPDLAVSPRVTIPVPEVAPIARELQSFESPSRLVVVGAVPVVAAPAVAAVASVPLGDTVEVVGRVRLNGTPPPEIPIDMGPQCGKLPKKPMTTRHYVVSADGSLANVLVYVQQGLTRRYPISSEAPVLDQIGCSFEPYVTALQARQIFRIRNSDPTLHNIHATPKSNRGFNLGQPAIGMITEKSFATPELFIRLKCDVHPWMFAYVSVLGHPFFSVTDTNGSFRLPRGLPAGDYTIAAQHLKAGEVQTQITLVPGEQRELELVLDVPQSISRR